METLPSTYRIVSEFIVLEALAILYHYRNNKLQNLLGASQLLRRRIMTWLTLAPSELLIAVYL